MSKSIPDDLRATLEDILAQLANLSERVSAMEKLVPAAGREPAPAASTGDVETSVSEAPAAISPVAAEAGISEEELLAISAALAAWLGVQPLIRQVRLIRSSAWAQQGRVTIQASHGLQH